MRFGLFAVCVVAVVCCCFVCFAVLWCDLCVIVWLLCYVVV